MSRFAGYLNEDRWPTALLSLGQESVYLLLGCGPAMTAEADVPARIAADTSASQPLATCLNKPGKELAFTLYHYFSVVIVDVAFAFQSL